MTKIADILLIFNFPSLFISEIVNKGKAQRSALKGPLRALRLCVLCILAPVSLIAVPLYLRYHVYNEQMYPLGVSDMRLVDSSVSTTWCQVSVPYVRHCI